MEANLCTFGAVLSVQYSLPVVPGRYCIRISVGIRVSEWEYRKKMGWAKSIQGGRGKKKGLKD